jgi:DNA-binding response OmpR family regulator
MKKTILIVEDDALLSQALSDTLITAEYSVVSATRLSDALHKTNNQRFACILVDLQLESGSGLNVIQQIRNETAKQSLNFKTPIILMSGYLEPDVIRGIANKVQGVLAKPFDVGAILSKIHELTSSTAAGRTRLG